jgi:hypothetical protein
MGVLIVATVSIDFSSLDDGMKKTILDNYFTKINNTTEKEGKIWSKSFTSEQLNNPDANSIKIKVEVDSNSGENEILLADAIMDALLGKDPSHSIYSVDTDSSDEVKRDFPTTFNGNCDAFDYAMNHGLVQPDKYHRVLQDGAPKEIIGLTRNMNLRFPINRERDLTPDGVRYAIAYVPRGAAIKDIRIGKNNYKGPMLIIEYQTMEGESTDD